MLHSNIEEGRDEFSLNWRTAAAMTLQQQSLEGIFLLLSQKDQDRPNDAARTPGYSIWTNILHQEPACIPSYLFLYIY